MKSSHLTIAIVCLLASVGACTSSNAHFCQNRSDCLAGERCESESQACVPNLEPDAAPLLAIDGGICNTQCMASAPLGWLGPMARSVASAEAPAECSESFSEEHSLLFSDIVVDNDCACSCGKTTKQSCSMAKIQEWTRDEPSCEFNECSVSAPLNGGSGSGSGCIEDTLQIAHDSCPEVQSTMKNSNVIKGTLGSLSGGSCTAPTATGTTSSSFETQTRLCQAELSGVGCAAEEVCAPTLDDDFEAGLCIVQEGEHACPESSTYTERFVVFDSIDDSQSCDASSCSCAVPTGSCGGQIELRAGNEFSCGAILATLKGASGTIGPIGSGGSNLCAARPAAFARVTYSPDLANRTCPRSGLASVVGQASGAGATTICCSL